MVEVLEGVLEDDESHDEATSLSLCYGLLRESPQLWSGEYTAGDAHVEEEDTEDNEVAEEGDTNSSVVANDSEANPDEYSQS